MLKHQLFGATLVIGLIALPASAFQTGQTTPPPTPRTTPPTSRPTPRPTPQGQTGTSKATGETTDAKFITTAYEDGQAEIELADLASSKSQNAGVKALANKIKTDHEQANNELKTLAGSKGATLPEATSSAAKRTAAETEHQTTMSRLQKLDGAAFDRAYATAMVTDHRKAITEFTKASKSSDPEIKAFADKTLPVLKDHLQGAEDLQKKSGK